MVEIPSNSNISKTETQVKELPAKNVTPVVKGELKKKSKIAEALIASTGDDIKNYILLDVLIPTIKRGIETMITGALSMLFWGNAKSGSALKKPGGIISYNTSNVVGNTVIKTISQAGSNIVQQNLVSRNTDNSFSDLVLSNRGEAEAILDAMGDILETYGIVTVADMYDLADIEVTNYLVNDYGWNNLAGAKIEVSRDGWVLKMPRPSHINK